MSNGRTRPYFLPLKKQLLFLTVGSLLAMRLLDEESKQSPEGIPLGKSRAVSKTVKIIALH